MPFRCSHRVKLLIVLYFVLLHYRSTIRYRKFLRVSALGPSSSSSWLRILASKDDLAMLQFCGVNCSGFRYLLRLFAGHSYFSTDRRKCIGPVHILGITLSYMRSKGQQYTLQAFFNISDTELSFGLI